MISVLNRRSWPGRIQALEEQSPVKAYVAILLRSSREARVKRRLQAAFVVEPRVDALLLRRAPSDLTPQTSRHQM